METTEGMTETRHCRICGVAITTDVMCSTHLLAVDMAGLVVLGAISDWEWDGKPTHRTLMTKSAEADARTVPGTRWQDQVDEILKRRRFKGDDKSA